MIQNIQWISIRQLADRLLQHPLMQDLNLEYIVRYTVDFINTMGFPGVYEPKEITIDIENFRSILPSDLISINGIKDIKTKQCLRHSTDVFEPSDNKDYNNLTYKLQGDIIYTSFKQGSILINYNSIPVDESGFPLIPDNTAFVRALESFIKKEYFTILFEIGKIQSPILQNIQQDYAWKVGVCDAEFNMPSPAEMESITNMWNQLLPRTNEFITGFKKLGNKELYKKH